MDGGSCTCSEGSGPAWLSNRLIAHALPARVHRAIRDAIMAAPLSAPEEPFWTRRPQPGGPSLTHRDGPGCTRGWGLSGWAWLCSIGLVASESACTLCSDWKSWALQPSFPLSSLTSPPHPSQRAAQPSPPALWDALPEPVQCYKLPK